MKKLLGLLFFVVVLNGCDDGDLTIENISFEDVQAASCGETIYKLNGNQALYIKIPESENAFINETTPTDVPRVKTIGGNISVTYRAYNGTAVAANICNTPGPIFPVATQEWIATSGTIEISTIAVYTAPDAITGATKISKYIHNIVFKNIVFQKPEGQQVYERFAFGEYSTPATLLPLNFNAEDIQLCSSNQTLYNARTNGIEAMYIQNLDANLLATTNLGVAKTGLISDTANHLVYRLFQTALTTSNQDYFCGTTLPGTPEIDEEWIANNGVSNVSGIIEVTTTTNGTGFSHSIYLKAVTFQKGNNTFYLGDSILFGTLLTAN